MAWLSTNLWLAGNEGTEKKMAIIKMAYIGTTIRIHDLIPCSPKASERLSVSKVVGCGV